MADENLNENEDTETPAEEAPVEEPVAEEAAAEAEETAEEPVVEAPAAAAGEEAAAEALADEPVAEPAEEAAAETPAPEATEAPVGAPSAEEAVAAPQSGPKPKRKRLPRSERRQRAKPKRTVPTTRKPIVRLEKPEHERGRRQERQGRVVSDAMEKTIVVRVDLVKAHPKYKKV